MEMQFLPILDLPCSRSRMIVLGRREDRHPRLPSLSGFTVYLPIAVQTHCFFGRKIYSFTDGPDFLQP